MPHFIFKSTTIAGRFTLRLVDKAKVKASPQIVLVPEHLKVVVENRVLHTRALTSGATMDCHIPSIANEKGIF